MIIKIRFLLLLVCATASTVLAGDAATAPKIPGFSTNYLERSVSPATDFYNFACGQWRENNPIPADKSRWGGFSELAERNWFSIHEILEETLTAAAAPRSPRREVADFYASAMDTNQIEQLGLKPIQADLKRIDRVNDVR